MSKPKIHVSGTFETNAYQLERAINTLETDDFWTLWARLTVKAASMNLAQSSAIWAYVQSARKLMQNQIEQEALAPIDYDDEQELKDSLELSGLLDRIHHQLGKPVDLFGVTDDGQVFMLDTLKVGFFGTDEKPEINFGLTYVV